jgi:hypothetical protein
MESINISVFAEHAVDQYETKRDGRPMPVVLLSPPGQAKSSFIEGPVAQRLEAHYFPEAANGPTPERPQFPNVTWTSGGKVAVVTELLGNRDSLDVRGVLLPIKVKDGSPESAFTKPDIVATVETCYAAGAEIVILFFDELLQASPDVQKAATDILLNGRFGAYGVDKRTWILGASNRPQDGAGVNRALTILINRVVVFDVVLDARTWTAWARKKALPTIGIAFADLRPGVVGGMDTPPKSGPFSTWRSFTDAMRFVAVKKARLGDTNPWTLPDDAFTKARIAGSIGWDAMGELYEYAAVRDILPTSEQILREPHSARIPPPERLDGQFAVAQLLLSLRTDDNTDTLWTYAERLNKDIQSMLASEIMQASHGHVILSAPRFNAWYIKNRTYNAEVANAA